MCMTNNDDKIDKVLMAISIFMSGVVLVCATLAVLLTQGCRSIVGEHTGSSIIAGEHLMLPEVSSVSDTYSFRVLRTLKGMWVWTGKDYKIELEYTNSYTNKYLGMIETRDSMSMKATLIPLADPSTNAVPVAEVVVQ